MKKLEGYINIDDEKKIFYKAFYASKKYNSSVLAIHGWGEHTYRHEELCEYLSAEGISVLSFDLPGHGLSYGKRGHIENIDEYMKAIKLAYYKKQEIFFPKLNLIFGHSMGGNLALRYALENLEEKIDGLIISSPWLELKQKPGIILNLIGLFANKYYPEFTIKRKLKSSNLWSDSNAREKYKNDELTHYYISARCYYELLESSKAIFEKIRLLNKPTIILHGKKDEITSAEASVSLSTLNDNIICKIFDEHAHELHNSSLKEEFFKEIKNFILETEKKSLLATV